MRPRHRVGHAGGQPRPARSEVEAARDLCDVVHDAVAVVVETVAQLGLCRADTRQAFVNASVAVLVSAIGGRRRLATCQQAALLGHRRAYHKRRRAADRGVRADHAVALAVARVDPLPLAPAEAHRA